MIVNLHKQDESCSIHWKRPYCKFQLIMNAGMYRIVYEDSLTLHLKIEYFKYRLDSTKRNIWSIYDNVQMAIASLNCLNLQSHDIMKISMLSLQSMGVHMLGWQQYPYIAICSLERVTFKSLDKSTSTQIVIRTLTIAEQSPSSFPSVLIIVALSRP